MKKQGFRVIATLILFVLGIFFLYGSYYVFQGIWIGNVPHVKAEWFLAYALSVILWKVCLTEVRISELQDELDELKK